MEFSSVLAVSINKKDINKLLKKIAEYVIDIKYKYIYFFDENKNWLYIYSNQFEYISNNYLNRVVNFFDKKKYRYIYINIYDEKRLLFVFKISNELQIYSTKPQLWNIELGYFNYITYNSFFISDIRTNSENMEQFILILYKLELKLEYIFNGFDKITNNNCDMAKLIIDGERINDYEEYVQYHEILKKSRPESNFYIINENSITLLDSEVLSYMGNIDNLNSDIQVFTENNFNIINKMNYIYDCYIVVSKDCYIKFIYLGHEYFFYNEEIVIRIQNIKKSDFKILNITYGCIVVIYNCENKNYKKMNEDNKNIAKNFSGIKNIALNMCIYNHENRICQWSKDKSEWNIDSISSKNNEFPVIALSRKKSFSSIKNFFVDFKSIRVLECGHIHPEFSELYYCQKGKIELLTFNNREIKLEINEGEYALVMPHVPHMINNIMHNDFGEYSHLCFQFLSKFHYPFYKTKRNYNFNLYNNHNLEVNNSDRSK